MNKKLLGFLTISIFIIGGLFLSGCQKSEDLAYKPGKTIKPEDARIMAEDFINEFLMLDGTKASARNDGLAYDLYRLSIDIGSGESVESFITKDGRLFFPQVLDIKEIKEEESAQLSDQEEPLDIDLPKSDRPTVEMFIMTYCPYGTQIQKGILPVLEVLGDEIDFSQKFVDYAMQDKLELDENLLQYCLQEIDSEEFINYLECFLSSGESSSCLNQIDINQNELENCLVQTDQEYKITENYENQIGWQGNFPGFDVNKEEVEKYGVTGSPALVINGEVVPAWRSPAALLKIICSAFNIAPDACQVDLPANDPSPGFGYQESGSNAPVASCG